MEREYLKVIVFDISSEYAGWFLDRIASGDAVVVFLDPFRLENLSEDFEKGSWPLYSDRIERKFKSSTKKKEIYVQDLESNIRAVGPLLEGALTQAYYYEAGRMLRREIERHPIYGRIHENGKSILEEICDMHSYMNYLVKNKVKEEDQINDFIEDLKDKVYKKTITRLEQADRQKGKKMRDSTLDNHGKYSHTENVILKISRMPTGTAYIRQCAEVISDVLIRSNNFSDEVDKQIRFLLRNKHHILTRGDFIRILREKNRRNLMILEGNEEIVKEEISSILPRKLEDRKKGYEEKYLNLFIIDEAHIFAPSKSESNDTSTKNASDAIELIIRQGRKYNLGICLASQRATYLNTSIMSQLNTWFAGQLVFPTDRERIQSAYGISKDLISQTAYFPVGTWMCSSTKALAVRGVPIIVEADNAENPVLNFLSRNKSVDEKENTPQ